MLRFSRETILAKTVLKLSKNSRSDQMSRHRPPPLNTPCVYNQRGETCRLAESQAGDARTAETGLYRHYTVRSSRQLFVQRTASELRGVKVPQFSHFCLFFHITPKIRFYIYTAYRLVTLQNASGDRWRPREQNLLGHNPLLCCHLHYYFLWGWVESGIRYYFSKNSPPGSILYDSNKGCLTIYRGFCASPY